MDVDQHTTLRQAATTAKNEGVSLLVSRLKFEVWLLWHVSDSCAAKTTRRLDELMVERELYTQDKHLSLRFPIANVDKAVLTAREADPKLCSLRVGPDPSSAMPLLVQMMRGEDLESVWRSETIQKT